jgi:hypothetical protein
MGDSLFMVVFGCFQNRRHVGAGKFYYHGLRGTLKLDPQVRGIKQRRTASESVWQRDPDANCHAGMVGFIAKNGCAVRRMGMRRVRSFCNRAKTVRRSLIIFTKREITSQRA